MCPLRKRASSPSASFTVRSAQSPRMRVCSVSGSGQGISSSDLTGAEFSGAETADSLHVLRDYVNGIDRPAGSATN